MLPYWVMSRVMGGWSLYSGWINGWIHELELLLFLFYYFSFYICIYKICFSLAMKPIIIIDLYIQLYENPGDILYN